MQEQISMKIQGLTVGDRKVYQHIFDTFYHSLCLFTHRFVDDLSVCEDCVQEAFISLWNSRDEMESEAHVKSFLYQVSRNNALNYLKHERVKNEYLAKGLQEIESQVCFINYVIEEEVERILRRRSLSFPRNVERFSGLPCWGKITRRSPGCWEFRRTR